MLEHAQEYPNPTAAAEVIAKRNNVGAESVRRWHLQALIDGGERRGATTEELTEIRDLKAKVHRLEEDNDILRRVSTSSRVNLGTLQHDSKPRPRDPRWSAIESR